MGVNHRSHQPETRGKPGCQQRGNPGKYIRAEENRTKGAGIHAEAKVEPISSEALNNEAAAESVQREKTGKPENYLPRMSDARQPRFDSGTAGRALGRADFRRR